jgi:polyisoprenoid-binding protein YceI
MSDRERLLMLGAGGGSMEVVSYGGGSSAELKLAGDDGDAARHRGGLRVTTGITLIPTGTWVVDPVHSRVGFAVKHLGISTVRGEFKEFEGTLEIGEDLPTSRAYGTVKVASIDTRETDRDDHLRSPDFFDAAQFPEIAFESTKIEPLDEEEFRVTGRLTIHGVSNEIVLHAEVGGTEPDPWGNERIGLEVMGRLSRSDYGMKLQQTLGSGSLVVGDKVTLALDLSAMKHV